MKQHIDAVEGARQQVPVADVAFDHRYASAGHRFGKRVPAAAAQVVEHDDLRRAGRHQAVDDVRADQPGTAGDQDALAGQPAQVGRR